MRYYISGSFDHIRAILNLKICLPSQSKQHHIPVNDETRGRKESK